MKSELQGIIRDLNMILHRVDSLSDNARVHGDKKLHASVTITDLLTFMENWRKSA